MKRIELPSTWRTNSVLRYLIVGVWNTVFSITLLYVLFLIFTIKFYEYELCASYVLSTVQSYTTQRLLVWKSTISHKTEFSLFILSAISQYVLNAIMLYFAVHYLEVYPTYAALPIVLILTCGFYFVNKNIVFRTKKGKNG